MLFIHVLAICHFEGWFVQLKTGSKLGNREILPTQPIKEPSTKFFLGAEIASYADVLRLVTRSSPRVTSLRTSAWEARVETTLAEKIQEQTLDLKKA